MSKMEGTGELYYKLVPEEIATKFAGLDPNARLVYVVCSKKRVGCWLRCVLLWFSVSENHNIKNESTINNSCTFLSVSIRRYQSIQRAGVNGAWTKDIRRETNIQQQALNKIFKALEGRRLIKQVKSVNAKAKKLYM